MILNKFEGIKKMKLLPYSLQKTSSTPTLAAKRHHPTLIRNPLPLGLMTTRQQQARQQDPSAGDDPAQTQTRAAEEGRVDDVVPCVGKKAQAESNAGMYYPFSS